MPWLNTEEKGQQKDKSKPGPAYLKRSVSLGCKTWGHQQFQLQIKVNQFPYHHPAQTNGVGDYNVLTFPYRIYSNFIQNIFILPMDRLILYYSSPNEGL